MTKEDIYKLLIRMHRWTFDQIADLNHWQQMIAADVELSNERGSVHFSTMDEYLAWKAAR